MIPPFHSLPSRNETKTSYPSNASTSPTTAFFSILCQRPFNVRLYASRPGKPGIHTEPDRTEAKAEERKGKGGKGRDIFFDFFFLMRALQCIADGAVEGILGHDELGRGWVGDGDGRFLGLWSRMGPFETDGLDGSC